MAAPTVRLELSFNADDDNSESGSQKKRIDSDALSNMTMWSKYEYQGEIEGDGISSCEDIYRKESGALSQLSDIEVESSSCDRHESKTKEPFSFLSFKFSKFKVPGIRWHRNSSTGIHGELIEELSPENMDKGDECDTNGRNIENRNIVQRRHSADRIKTAGTRARRTLTAVLASFACLGRQRLNDEGDAPYLSAKEEGDLKPPRLEIIDSDLRSATNEPGSLLDPSGDSQSAE